MTSSIYPFSVSQNNTPIIAANDILASPITITSDMVKPGGAGILRLYFSFEFDTSPAIVTIFNDGLQSGDLNADNNSQVIDDGLYRFDIDIEAGDLINLRADSNVSTINYVRAHLIQFGA